MARRQRRTASGLKPYGYLSRLSGSIDVATPDLGLKRSREEVIGREIAGFRIVRSAAAGTGVVYLTTQIFPEPRIAPDASVLVVDFGLLPHFNPSQESPTSSVLTITDPQMASQYISSARVLMLYQSRAFRATTTALVPSPDTSTWLL
jgi:hypothetical protein